MAAGVITKLVGPSKAFEGWTASQAGSNWDYVLEGEPMTANTRVALRFVRTGDTLELYAAYDDDAPAVGDPTSGTFHLVNSQSISGGVLLHFAMHTGILSASIDFDDIYVTGPMIPDYTSPNEDPAVGQDIVIENSTNIGNGPEVIYDVASSHDGKKVVYLSAPFRHAYWELVMFDFLTQETTTLVRHQDVQPEDAGYFLEGGGIAWSPDDQYIYFASIPAADQRP